MTRPAKPFGLGGRGRLHPSALRRAVLSAVRRVIAGGGRGVDACRALGVSPRTVRRWRRGLVDARTSRAPVVRHAFGARARARLFRLLSASRHRGLSVRQLVPLLADRGIYVASEATLYRMLRARRRRTTRSGEQRTRATSHRATGPRQVWTWDITRLRGRRSAPYFLYVVLDVWSRKIVGWALLDRESAVHSAGVIERACRDERVARRAIVLHADNGPPMRAPSLLATLRRLGVATSFTRTRAPNDNPISEALFGTMKRRASFPRKPFASIAAARAWVAKFVRWYNDEHLHSALRYVTPSDRHAGRDVAILARRRRVYEKARQENPRRWARGVRDWRPIAEVILNPHGTR